MVLMNVFLIGQSNGLMLNFPPMEEHSTKTSSRPTQSDSAKLALLLAGLPNLVAAIEDLKGGLTSTSKLLDALTQSPPPAERIDLGGHLYDVGKHLNAFRKTLDSVGVHR